jgi:hypothetical protein
MPDTEQRVEGPSLPDQKDEDEKAAKSKTSKNLTGFPVAHTQLHASDAWI